MTEPRDAAAIELIRATIRDCLTRLQETGARDEALAEFVPARRVLRLFTRESRMTPIGRAWPLGVFLLDAEATLYAAGSTTRAVPAGYPGHQSVSAEQRREFRAAAARGPFAPGETIDFDAVAIELRPEALTESRGPLFIRDGRPLVRWSRSAPDTAARPFEEYLTERTELLIKPPDGA